MPSQKKDSPLQNITAHLAADLPMVLYRKPLEEKVNCILQNNSTINFLKDYNQRGFVLAPFDAEDNTALLIHGDQFFEYSPVLPENWDRSKEFEIDEDTEFHLELVNKAIEAIKEGRFKKVIASRCIDVKSGAAPLELFLRILAIYPSAFCYYFFHPKIGTWLGASPELLISVKGLDFRTTSLAGTLPVIKDEAPKWSSKEFEEQQMVTGFIEKALTSLEIPLTTAAVENQKAGKLWHLKSELRGKFNSFKQLDLVIKALHPTPAVCGLPKKEAKDFIRSNENYERRFYTGYLGQLNLNKENTANLYVNLRCMEIVDKIAKIYVGGGITIDSIAENELEETIAKSRTMLDLL